MITKTLGPIGLSLLMHLVEADEDANVILDLPYEMRSGPAFGDAFSRLGVRDEKAHEFAQYLVCIPHEKFDTRAYESANWLQRTEEAQKIARRAIALYREEVTLQAVRE
jgi:hypothetical protein